MLDSLDAREAAIGENGSSEPASIPRLSIVIPAYNVAPYIEAAVNSALDQTLRDIEIVVVDDGSTDTTPDILADLARERADHRLRIIRQDNGGLSAARNTGILNARAPLIGFLDADDIWLPQKAERHVAAMDADPTIGISFSHSEYITDAGARTGTLLLAGCAQPTVEQMIRRNHVGNGSSPVVRRDCFDTAGLFRFDLRSCEDYEMWCRVLSSTRYRAELVAEPLTLYRLRATSLTFNFDGFLANAEAAMQYLRSTIPNVSDSVFRSGHAEHYRIVAWKAVSTGQRQAGMRLMKQALRLDPGLILRDWRAAATIGAAALPGGLRNTLARHGKSLQRRFAQ